MEIFDDFSLNGIENFLENVILKVSDTFSKDFYPKEGPMPPPPWLRQGGGINFSRGGGGVKYPSKIKNSLNFTLPSILFENNKKLKK